MASGMGVRGTTGRCYGFFADFKDCTARLRQNKLTEENKEDWAKLFVQCAASREDYFECLHGKKENQRIRTVLEEQKKQEYEAKHGTASH